VVCRLKIVKGREKNLRFWNVPQSEFNFPFQATKKSGEINLEPMTNNFQSSGKPPPDLHPPENIH
jgi:hypothetical protein